MNALDYLDEAAAPRLDAIRKLPRKPGTPAPRADGYVGSLLKHLTGKYRVPGRRARSLPDSEGLSLQEQNSFEFNKARQRLTSPCCFVR